MPQAVSGPHLFVEGRALRQDDASVKSRFTRLVWCNDGLTPVHEFPEGVLRFLENPKRNNKGVVHRDLIKAKCGLHVELLVDVERQIRPFCLDGRDRFEIVLLEVSNLLDSVELHFRSLKQFLLIGHV